MAAAPGFDARKLLAYALTDPSSWSLLASNALTIGFGLMESVSLLSLMWVYWCQSIIIGGFNVLKILGSEGAGELIVNGQKAVGFGAAGRLFFAGFFAVHYGFFHFVYAIFLGIGSLFSEGGNEGFLGLGGPLVDFSFVALAALLFFGNHFYSFIVNRAADRKKTASELMMAPYARIIPMHLTIIFGSMLMLFGGVGQTLAYLLFGGLKTLADLALHVGEHSQAGQAPTQSPTTLEAR